MKDIENNLRILWINRSLQNLKPYHEHLPHSTEFGNSPAGKRNCATYMPTYVGPPSDSTPQS